MRRMSAAVAVTLDRGEMDSHTIMHRVKHTKGITVLSSLTWG